MKGKIFNAQEVVKNEIIERYNQITKDWNKNIPLEYYWKACPISTPQRFKLEDDIFCTVNTIISEVANKYLLELELCNWKFCKETRLANFDLKIKGEENER